MATPEMSGTTSVEQTARSPDPPRRGWFRLLLFGPVALFLVLMLAFVMGLGRDPKIIPSLPWRYHPGFLRRWYRRR